MTANGSGNVSTITPPASSAPEVRIVGKNEDASLQKDMFLKLMIAQLKNQDPTAPMDQKDMMASMTQFSQVEQMQNMSQAMETLSLAQGIGMIGREVTYSKVVKNDQGQTVGEKEFTGRVASLEQGNGGMKLVLELPPNSPADAVAVRISPSEVTKVFA
ncbi:MAG: flagellar hook assembly protein FlgD [Thermoleophilia bacterium]|nr:flagellar hook assembly protein FlgD [Thermoleophilia bacterium]